jgi:hypothetical protein
MITSNRGDRVFAPRAAWDPLPLNWRLRGTSQDAINAALIPDSDQASWSLQGDEATIDDPGAYTEPWTIGFDIVWDEKGEMQEYICQENSVWMRKVFRDVQNMIDAQR